MSVVETVIIRRRKVDPAAPVIPTRGRAYPHVTRRLEPPRAAQTPQPVTPGGIFKTISTLSGPYAIPVSEISVGAYFAVSQIQHVFERVSPGAAQLWRADGSSGALWHILAAAAGLAAAIHGIVKLVKAVRANQQKKTPAA